MVMTFCYGNDVLNSFSSVMTIRLIVELLLAMVRILCVCEDISAGIGEDSNNIILSLTTSLLRRGK